MKQDNQDKKTLGTVFLFLGIIFLFICLIFGIIFILVGRGLENSASKNAEAFEEFKDSAIKTHGEVISSQDSGTLVLYEDDEGEEFEVELNIESSEYAIGTKVDVYYDEDHHEEAFVPQLQIETIESISEIMTKVGRIAFVVGGVPGVLGIVLGLVFLIKSKKEYS